MPVKWGVIGCGNILKRAMGEALTKTESCQLIAVADIDEEKARELQRKYGAKRFYKNPEDILRDEEIEAVYVAAPVYLHCKFTTEAARAKKHVLCEKPMALTVKECREMIETCRKNKVKLMIGFMMRFHACHQKAKEMIENGELGQIVLVRAQLSYWYPPDPSAWQQKKELSGGGSLMDAGSHCIDLLRYLLGKEVVEVEALADNLVFDYGVEDTATILMRFESGTQAIVDSCFSTPDESVEQRLEIYGTKGSLLGTGTISPFPTGSLKINIGGKKIDYKFKPVELYQAELEHFSQCILEDRQPLIPGEDGLRSIKVIGAAYKSSEEGRRIKLPLGGDK